MWSDTVRLSEAPQIARPCALRATSSRRIQRIEILTIRFILPQARLGPVYGFAETATIGLQTQRMRDIQQCMIFNVRRCRRRALEYCPYNIPVFCPLDNVMERTECKLGDFNFLHKEGNQPIKLIWLHRPRKTAHDID